MSSSNDHFVGILRGSGMGMCNIMVTDGTTGEECCCKLHIITVKVEISVWGNISTISVPYLPPRKIIPSGILLDASNL
jgi:hypothetical protein